ncbi:RNA polymerase sigma factor [Paenibacillus turpanensis]|uniref:RNA polymerase sigma factor n=1 Tax=Paenibacillus turpanensis TaxID=2689078 RepID=UPI00140CA742|nr:sigma-70 family RNA polymerase sigma factor [Paenibacillus turpanensis]
MDYREQSDLIQELLDGKKAAFDRFYDRYAPLVVHIAQRITGDWMEAEDICHEVLLEALRKLKDYDPKRGSLDAWISVIAKSRSLDQLRKLEKMTAKTMDTLPEHRTASFSPEEALLRSVQNQELVAALHRLPVQQREALLATYWKSLTHKETAEALGRPLGTVKSVIRAGINNMKKQLTALQQGGTKDESYESPRMRG